MGEIAQKDSKYRECLRCANAFVFFVFVTQAQFEADTSKEAGAETKETGADTGTRRNKAKQTTRQNHWNTCRYIFIIMCMGRECV